MTAPSPAADVPTRLRWHIVAMLMGLCLISHVNRASMSVAGTDRIMGQFSIDPVKMGAVYSAFLLIYSICMIPGGLFIDRFGPRRALMVVGFGSALFGGRCSHSRRGFYQAPFVSGSGSGTLARKRGS